MYYSYFWQYWNDLICKCGSCFSFFDSDFEWLLIKWDRRNGPSAGWPWPTRCDLVRQLGQLDQQSNQFLQLKTWGDAGDAGIACQSSLMMARGSQRGRARGSTADGRAGTPDRHHERHGQRAQSTIQACKAQRPSDVTILLPPWLPVRRG